jgi:4-amino-4-deoxy-L-arabinose transferase-like glycosyltransferase
MDYKDQSYGIDVRTWMAPAIIIIAAAALFLNLGIPSLWGSEGRWAVIARYMFRTKDFFHPMLGNYPYWDKPLASYWQVIPFGYISGSVTEAASRMPSVIWAVVWLILTYSTASRLAGKKAATLSILALAGSYGFMFWGRNAQVEMSNAAVIMLAIWFFLRHKDDPGKAWFFALAVIAGLGANLKGLPAIGAPALAILLASLIMKDWKWFPKPHILIAAIILGLFAFISIPALAAYVTGSREPLDLVWKENVVRFFSPFDHKDPFYVYFIRIFDLFAPWSILLPVAFVYIFRKGRFTNQGVKTVLLYFAGIFMFFTLSGSRRSYYILPALPFAAMIVGIFLSEIESAFTSRGYRIFFTASGVLFSLCLIAPVFILTIKPDLIPVANVKSLLPIAAMLLVIGMYTGFYSIRIKPVPVMAGLLSVWLIYAAGIIPFVSNLPGNIRSEVNQLKSTGRQVSYLSSDDAKIIFYLDKPYTVFTETGQAGTWAQNTHGIILAHDEVTEPGWNKLYEVGKCIAYEIGDDK